MPERRPSLRLAAGALEVVFEWAGDRWAHSVFRGGELLAASVEGPWPAGGDPRWPASPALQEVMAEAAGGRPALLALGHAGRSHYSASVAADPDSADTLRFELACRIATEPVWIGSTYRRPGEASGPAVVRAADPGGGLPRTVQWRYAWGPDGLAAGGPPAGAGREP
jgi:hypothetical protein